MRAVLVLLVGSACGISVNEPAQRPSSAVAVLNPGAEPRVKVRYAPEQDLVQRMELAVKARVKTDGDDADFPTFKLTGRVKVKDVTPAGDARVLFKLEDVDVEDDADDEEARAVLIRDAERMKGLRGSWVRAPDGAMSDIVLDVPDASRSVKERIALVTDALNATAIVFPDVELGAGAEWQVTSRTALWKRTVTYRLREVTEDDVVVEANAVMDARPQVVSNEGNATTELTSGSSSGTAALRIPLREIVATGWSEGTNEASFAIVKGTRRKEQTVMKETKFSIKAIGRPKRDF